MIRLSCSVVGVKEAQALSRVIQIDGYLGMGKEVAAFEEELASYLKVKRDSVICVGSGTAALHLALQTIINAGDEVLVPSLTFVATYQAITAAHGVPVSCDVNQENGLLDLQDAASKVSLKTKVLLYVHYASNPGNLEAVYNFAAQHRLRVIEDAAHSFGGMYKGQKIGSFGDIICFSFDGIKNITSGEGGAVVSFNDTETERIKDARLLGVEKDSTRRFAGLRSWDFDVHFQGYRYHMSNLMAAIGRVQLTRLEGEFAPMRKHLAAVYRQRLSAVSDICFLTGDFETMVPHLQPIRVLRGHRDGLKEYLQQQEIETGIHYKPNHLLSFFKENPFRNLSVCELLYGQLLSLPLHPLLSVNRVEEICTHIVRYLDSSFFT